MTIAYSYVRFSSKKQELSDSKRRQIDAARKYASAHDLVLSEDTFEDLGVSAYRGKNAAEGALGAFLAAVDAGHIDSSAKPGEFGDGNSSSKSSSSCKITYPVAYTWSYSG